MIWISLEPFPPAGESTHNYSKLLLWFLQPYPWSQKSLFSAFIVKPIPGSDALSYKRGFSLVHLCRRSEKRQIVKAADNIWTLFKFVRTSRWQFGTFFFFFFTMTLLPARERRDKHGLRAVERKWEKREVVEGGKEEKKGDSLLSSSSPVSSLWRTAGFGVFGGHGHPR